MKQTVEGIRRWLGDLLLQWSENLHQDRGSAIVEPVRRLSVGRPGQPLQATKVVQHPASIEGRTAEALSPGVREPLSVENAVLTRDLTVLKREAADALAALGAAHALVSSARLTQVQELHHRFDQGEVPAEALASLAGDYQGWQNDQVRLFDALSLVLRMRVPKGMVLEQMDPALHGQAREHLETLSLEYQRGLLMAQFGRSS